MHAEKRTLLVIAVAVLLMGGVIAWLLSSKPTTGPVKDNGKDVLQEVNGSTIQETKTGKKSGNSPSSPCSMTKKPSWPI